MLVVLRRGKVDEMRKSRWHVDPQETAELRVGKPVLVGRDATQCTAVVMDTEINEVHATLELGGSGRVVITPSEGSDVYVWTGTGDDMDGASVRVDRPYTLKSGDYVSLPTPLVRNPELLNDHEITNSSPSSRCR